MPETRPGRPVPLGATWDGEGVNFALFSAHATAVELCFFDEPDAPAEAVRLPVTARTNGIWHVYVPGVQPGQLYGYRVHGPYDPARGHRFNPHKVVLDPYARVVGRPPRWAETLFGYAPGHPEGDLARDPHDNAAAAPLAAVADPAFEWGRDRRPQIPWRETVIYEAHVKGVTALHPEVPALLRGTYLGLASEPMLDHLRRLGVTAVELMPVQHHADEPHLVRRGLTNYWGYSPLAFFAPETRYAQSSAPLDVVREFKTMVRALHAAGFEVILDVVFNHTAEGDHLGPTLSLRGIDNLVYYRLIPETPRFYEDFTGCGNTLNVRHPQVLQLVLDSLRYWVLDMHIDGFRFDLASALIRGREAVDFGSPFLVAIREDPVLSGIKLIAEPWDARADGYGVGRFPRGWAEWNGRYRDAVRRFWRGDRGVAAEFALRVAGSRDLYEPTGRGPTASVNYVTSHDGFTLQDLVSYNDKHNEANGEGNRDGETNNLSWNCGVEGPTADPAVIALRERQKRNFMATLLLSLGVPMISGGDELSRTQQGNNNAYCQDNPVSWYPWTLGAERRAFLEFTRRMASLRAAHPSIRRVTFPREGVPGGGPLAWYAPEGRPVTAEDWRAPDLQCLALRLAGGVFDETAEPDRSLRDETLLVLFNASADLVAFRLPPTGRGETWRALVDTADPSAEEPRDYRQGEAYPLQARSLALLVSA